jgi:hypothetical protein
MKSIYRLLKIVSYESMNEVLAKIIQEEEVRRNNIRKDSLDEIDKTDVVKDAEKIQRIMINMNRDLTTSYEKEKLLLEFINLVKS